MSAGIKVAIAAELTGFAVGRILGRVDCSPPLEVAEGTPMIRRFAPVLLAVLACENQSASPSEGASITLSIVSGDEQTGPAYQELPNPVVVKVVNGKGKEVSGQIVNFVIVTGGGSVFASGRCTHKTAAGGKRRSGRSSNFRGITLPRSFRDI